MRGDESDSADGRVKPQPLGHAGIEGPLEQGGPAFGLGRLDEARAYTEAGLARATALPVSPLVAVTMTARLSLPASRWFISRISTMDTSSMMTRSAARGLSSFLSKRR